MSMSITRATAALAVALGLAIGGAGSALAGPGDREFVALESHNPSAFLRAVRAGSDFVKGGRGREFRVIMANAAVISVIPGMVLVQRDLPGLMRGARGLSIVACKETIDLLSKTNKRRVPVIPGVQVSPCQSLRNKMMVAGWQPAPGIGD